MSLAQTIKDALQERAVLKERGFAGADLDAAFEKTVREAWPKGREWFYVCTACNDYGWEMFSCPGDETCGPSTWRAGKDMPCPNRPRKPHAPHEYVRLCFCAKGQELRRSAAASASEDFSSATKAKPKKPFTRWGSD